MRKLIYLSLTLTILIATSCSKEKRIERQFFSQGGNWKITKYKFTTYEDWYPVFEYSASNTGSIVFDKDGTGVFTNVNYNGDTETYNFDWRNTDRELTMIVNGVAIDYLITFDERKKKVLEHSDFYDDNGSSMEDRYIYTIEKQ